MKKRGANDPFYIAFGAKVQAVRRSQGLTQVDLAIRLGSNRSRIAQMENALGTTPLHVAQLVATALGVPLQDLIPSEEPQ